MKIKTAKILLLISGILMIISGITDICMLGMGVYYQKYDFHELKHVIDFILSIVNIIFFIGGGCAGIFVFCRCNYKNICRAFQYGIVILAFAIIDTVNVLATAIANQQFDILGITLVLVFVFFPTVYTIGAFILKKEWDN
ncbi:MAG: hypothetical protein RR734_03370 [Bacilli bacterium]